MFGMGMQELIIIAVVALLVLGPDRLPAAARSLGEGIRSLRKQTKDLQSTIEKDTEIGAAVRELRGALRGDPATVYRRVTGEDFIPPDTSTPVTKTPTEAKEDGDEKGASSEPADDTTASAEKPDVEATESEDSDDAPSKTQASQEPTKQESTPPRSTSQDS